MTVSQSASQSTSQQVSQLSSQSASQQAIQKSAGVVACRLFNISLLQSPILDVADNDQLTCLHYILHTKVRFRRNLLAHHSPLGVLSIAFLRYHLTNWKAVTHWDYASRIPSTSCNWCGEMFHKLPPKLHYRLTKYRLSSERGIMFMESKINIIININLSSHDQTLAIPHSWHLMIRHLSYHIHDISWSDTCHTTFMTSHDQTHPHTTFMTSHDQTLSIPHSWHLMIRHLSYHIHDISWSDTCHTTFMTSHDQTLAIPHTWHLMIRHLPYQIHDISWSDTCHAFRELSPDGTSIPNAWLTLAQRRRRWANISPALGQRLEFVFIFPMLFIALTGILHESF